MFPVFQKKNLHLWGLCLGTVLIGFLVIGLMIAGRSPEKENPDRTAHLSSEGCFRILVAAKDRTSGLCDVMMLVSLNRDEGTLSVLQLPRDTYALYGNGSYRKLNGAPSSEGMEALCRMLEESFGIGVDRYVRLSADAFRRGVDALGGVEIELEEPMDYEDPVQGLFIHLDKGTHTLSGEEAEGFVRYRSGYVRGDLGRLDAQKIFLAAFAEKALATRSPVSLVRLASALLEDVETDLGFSDLTMLIGEGLALERESIRFVTAPGSEATGTGGGSYYVLSAPSMDDLLRQYFGKEGEGFDPDGRFLNGENAAFQRIYEQKIPYRVYSSKELDEGKLSVSRK